MMKNEIKFRIQLDLRFAQIKKSAKSFFIRHVYSTVLSITALVGSITWIYANPDIALSPCTYSECVSTNLNNATVAIASITSSNLLSSNTFVNNFSDLAYAANDIYSTIQNFNTELTSLNTSPPAGLPKAWVNFRGDLTSGGGTSDAGFAIGNLTVTCATNQVTVTAINGNNFTSFAYSAGDTLTFVSNGTFYDSGQVSIKPGTGNNTLVYNQNAGLCPTSTNSTTAYLVHINSSNNVAQVRQFGTGIYQVVFTNAMTSATYTAVATSSQANTSANKLSSPNVISEISTTSQKTAAFDTFNTNDNNMNTFFDSSETSIVFYQ